MSQGGGFRLVSRAASHNPIGARAVVAGYQGLGDVVQGAFFYGGLRAYNAAAAAAHLNAIRICDTSRANQLDIPLASNGGLDQTVLSGWSGVGTKIIMRVYNQIIAQSQADLQDDGNVTHGAILTGNTSTGKPFMTDQSAGSQLRSGSGVGGLVLPGAVFSYAARTGDFTTQHNILVDQGNGCGTFWKSTANSAGVALDSPLIGTAGNLVDDSIFHSIGACCAGFSPNNSGMYINGVQDGTITFAGAVSVPGGNGYNLYAAGTQAKYTEHCAWNLNLQSEFAALHANAAAYWGT